MDPKNQFCYTVNALILFYNNMNLKTYFVIVLSLMLTACISPPPPADVNNICHVFRQYPNWYRAAKDVERRWKVPVPVQMAIIHQESKFDAKARPARTKLFTVIPWKRPSSAYGYTQALESTWQSYKQNNGNLFSSREDFSDGVDFIGWYANQANVRAGISRSDTYSLYLAYHEGVGGYQHKSYLRKPWLLHVARKVNAKAQSYSMQLKTCYAG